MTLGLLILRLFTGLTLAAHGSQKLFGWFDGPGPRGTAGMFAKLGYRWPAVMGLLAGLSELVGGLMFAAGLLTPLAAIAIVVVMLNAIAAVHWANGFFMTRGGYEFNLILAAIAVGVSATGAGRASLDHLFGIEGSLSGLWWAPIVLAVAVGIAGLTDAFGREHSTTLPGHPAA